MSETIQTKRCSKCKSFKQLSEFYKDRRQKDEHDFYCKICRLKSTKIYYKTGKCKATRKRYEQRGAGKIARKRFRKTQKGIKYATKGKAQWRKNNPEHNKAGRVVQNAVKYGRLPAVNFLKCSCGQQAKHYHHHSYAPEHWLDVIPVCYTCHLRIHNNNFNSSES